MMERSTVAWVVWGCMPSPNQPMTTIPFTAILTFLVLILLGMPACGQSKDAMLQFQLSDQLKQSAVSWNKGDIEAFLEGYLKSEELVFTSGGRVLRGYQALSDLYHKNYGQSRDAMGQLSFSDVEAWRLGEARALVMGRWKLDRKEAGGTTSSDGVFSLVMVQDGAKWKIFHDHTSFSGPR